MTTADDLLAAIDAADPAKCARLLMDLEEKARRVLHPAVAQRITKLDKEILDLSNPNPSRASIPVSARPVNPPPACQRNSRRVRRQN